MIIRAALLRFSPVIVVACQASAGAQLEAKSGTGVDADADANVNAGVADANGSSARAAFKGSPGTEDESAPSGSSGQEAMLGARAGLHLKSSTEPVCRCLRVAVGSPTDAAFLWDGPMTLTNPETQLVIALSSEGVPCPNAPTDSLGASYRGYELMGNDVMVEVETGRLGRPIAQGAVLPKPPPGGRVMVRATDRTSPYGQSLDGSSLSCNVWTAR